MFLKKEVLQVPFLKIKCFDLIYEDSNDLRYGIINLCNLLKKDIFIFEVFSKDPLNGILKANCKEVINYRNFICYFKKDIDIIRQLNFESVRFLCIYAIKEQFIENNMINILKSFSFGFELDNYSESVKIKINYDDYDDSVISKIQIK
ncbi:MAG: hypothetical protein HFK09_06765 [Clostridia bacterium]|nr:hypothetical protein [Clostridia bacterium]